MTRSSLFILVSRPRIQHIVWDEPSTAGTSSSTSQGTGPAQSYQQKAVTTTPTPKPSWTPSPVGSTRGMIIRNQAPNRGFRQTQQRTMTRGSLGGPRAPSLRGGPHARGVPPRGTVRGRGMRGTRGVRDPQQRHF